MLTTSKLIITIFSTNKIKVHDITEISLQKVAINIVLPITLLNSVKTKLIITIFSTTKTDIHDILKYR
jgi:hypothetical protein